MNREEFLVQASAYIGVAVGMRDGEMVIDGPHAIVELSNTDDSVFVQTPDVTDFIEAETGDFTECLKELKTMVDEGRVAFDASVLALRAAVAEHVAAINPSLGVNVFEDCYKCSPRATFYLQDTGIILYRMTMYGTYPDFEAWQKVDIFDVEVKNILDKRHKWAVGETGAIEVDEDGFLMAPNLHAFLGSCLAWKVNEFVSTIHTSIQLPDINAFRELVQPVHRKFVSFEVL